MSAAVIWIALRRRHACHYGLRFSEAQGADQLLSLKPAKPKNPEQPARDCGRLRNDPAVYLEVIEKILKIGTV